MPYKKKRGSGRKSKGKKKGKSKRGSKRKSKGKSKVMSIIRTMVKMTQPIPFIQNWAARFTAGVGQSCLIPICYWNDAIDLSTMHNLLQTALNQGSGFINKPLLKFAVGKFEGFYDMKIANNIDTLVDFYHVIARNDVDVTICPTVTLGPGVTGVDVLNYLIVGYFECTGTTPTKTAWPIGVKPFDIPKFCSAYKIIKTTSVKMIGGACKHITFTDKKWRLWNGDKIAGANNVSSTPDVGFARRTHWVFAIARGIPVSDVTNLNNVSTGPVSIELVSRERYRYTGLPNAVVSFTNPTNGFGAITTLSTITAQTELVVPLASA